MSPKLPAISRSTPEEEKYNRALVAKAVCINGQLNWLLMDFNFTDMKTIKEQEKIIRAHLLEEADANGDRPIDNEVLASVNRMHTGTDKIDFGKTYRPLASKIDETLKESKHSGSSCTAFVVVDPPKGFSYYNNFTPQSTFSAIWASVRSSGHQAFETHFRKQSGR